MINCKYDIRCEMCGKFCKPYDSGTYWGGTLDMEPPDPSYFCRKCVKKELKYPEKVIIGCWWLKPKYVYKVIAIRGLSNL